MANATDSVCLNDPNFAVICSFLKRYGELLGLPDLSFVDLQTILEESKFVPKIICDMHIRLLRRLGKSPVSAEKWERALVKYCYTYSEVDGWEVEQLGYKKCKLTTKINILKHLLEAQFDYNSKFKEKINEQSAEQLRVQPIGRDKNGLAYWFLLDNDLNIRIYREDQDDVGAESWEMVCKDRQDLEALINSLDSDKLGIKTQDSSRSVTPSVAGSEVSEKNGKVEVNGATDVKIDPTEKTECEVKSEPGIKSEPKEKEEAQEDIKPPLSGITVKQEPPDLADVGNSEATTEKGDAESSKSAQEETLQPVLADKVEVKQEESVKTMDKELNNLEGSVAKTSKVVKCTNASASKNEISETEIKTSKKDEGENSVETSNDKIETKDSDSGKLECIDTKNVDNKSVSTNKDTTDQKIESASKNRDTLNEKSELSSDAQEKSRKAKCKTEAYSKDRSSDKDSKEEEKKSNSDKLTGGKLCVEGSDVEKDQSTTESKGQKVTKIEEPTESENEKVKTNNQEETETGISRKEEKDEKTETGISRKEEKDEETETGISGKEEKDEIETGKSAKEEKNEETETGISGKEEKNEETETGISGKEEKNEETETGISRKEEKDVVRKENSKPSSEKETTKKCEKDTDKKDICKDKTPSRVASCDVVCGDKTKLDIPTKGECLLTAPKGSDEKKFGVNNDEAKKDGSLDIGATEKVNKEELVKKEGGLTDEKETTESSGEEIKGKDQPLAKLDDKKEADLASNDLAEKGTICCQQVSESVSEVDCKRDAESTIVDSEKKDTHTRPSKETGKDKEDKKELMEKKGDTKKTTESCKKDAEQGVDGDSNEKELGGKETDKTVESGKDKDVKTEPVTHTEENDKTLTEVQVTQEGEAEAEKESMKDLDKVGKDPQKAVIEEPKKRAKRKKTETKEGERKGEEAKEVEGKKAKEKCVKADEETHNIPEGKGESQAQADEKPKPKKRKSGETDIKSKHESVTKAEQDSVESESESESSESDSDQPLKKRARKPGPRKKKGMGRGRGRRKKDETSESEESNDPEEKSPSRKRTKKDVKSPVGRGQGKKNFASDDETENKPPVGTVGRGRGRGRGRGKTGSTRGRRPGKGTDRKRGTQDSDDSDDSDCKPLKPKASDKKSKKKESSQDDSDVPLIQLRRSSRSTKGRGAERLDLSQLDSPRKRKSKQEKLEEQRQQKEALKRQRREEQERKRELQEQLERKKKKRRGKTQDEEFVPGYSYKPGKGRRRKRALTSESSSEEFEIEEEEESESSLHFTASDSDPGIESEGSEYKPKGRNLKRSLARKSCEKKTESDEEVVENDDKPCSRCLKYDKPEWILLCDKCDAGYHTACLRPPLLIIPDGDWFCPPCEHHALVEKLTEQLKELDQQLKKKERLQKRKERLAFVGISLDNIIKKEEPKPRPKREREYELRENGDFSEEEEEEEEDEEEEEEWYMVNRRSRRKHKDISYKFREFDELIDSAIQDDMDEASGYGKGKDMSNITGKDMSTITGEHEESNTSGGKDMSALTAPKPPPRPARGGKNMANIEGMPIEELEKDKPPPVVRRKKRRRLTQLDSDSNNSDESEDYHATDDSASEVSAEEEPDDGLSEESEDWAQRRRRSRFSKPTRRSKRSRRSGYRYDDDFVVDSEYDSEDSDGCRRSKRRAAQKSINYRDVSDSGEERQKDHFQSDDSDIKLNRKKSRNSYSRTPRKRVVYSDNSEEDSEATPVGKKRRPSVRYDCDSEYSPTESDQSGPTRTSRRAAAKKVNYRALAGDTDEEEDGEEICKKKKKSRLDMSRYLKSSSESEATDNYYEPEESEEDTEEEEGKEKIKNEKEEKEEKSEKEKNGDTTSTSALEVNGHSSKSDSEHTRGNIPPVSSMKADQEENVDPNHMNQNGGFMIENLLRDTKPGNLDPAAVGLDENVPLDDEDVDDDLADMDDLISYVTQD